MSLLLQGRVVVPFSFGFLGLFVLFKKQEGLKSFTDALSNVDFLPRVSFLKEELHYHVPIPRSVPLSKRRFVRAVPTSSHGLPHRP